MVPGLTISIVMVAAAPVAVRCSTSVSTLYKATAASAKTSGVSMSPVLLGMVDLGFTTTVFAKGFHMGFSEFDLLADSDYIVQR